MFIDAGIWIGIERGIFRLGGDCSGGEGDWYGTPSVQTDDLLSRYSGPGIECCGNASGCFRLSGLFDMAAIVDLLFIKEGKFGLRVGTGIPDVMRGLFGTSMRGRGDLSCQPSGEGSFVSVGRLIGPNGETPSWAFSHELSVGAFGGFEGFHGTVVVFTIEVRCPEDFSPVVFCNCENETGDPLIGPFLVPG